MQLNFNNMKDKMTDNDVEQILAIVGKGCHLKTFKRLESILKYHKSMIPEYGIMGRLIKEGDKWGYCAGQSYTDEIRTVRQIILTGK